MEAYRTDANTLDPGLTALALRALNERGGHYPFIKRLSPARLFRRNGTGAAPARPRPATGRTAPYLVLVRRGEAALYWALKQGFREVPDLVHVTWDRRSRERRARYDGAAPNRRRGERRGRPPGAWETFGFIIVPQGDATSGR